MTRLALALLAASAAIIEASIAPGFAPGVLPIALIAAWGVLRGVDEVMLAAPAIAVPLGVMSQERIGWFVIATLPLLLALVVARRSDERMRSVVLGAAIAGSGSAAFGLVLLLIAGHPRTLSSEVPTLLATAGATALCAGISVLLLWRWRAHTSGLFA